MCNQKCFKIEVTYHDIVKENYIWASNLNEAIDIAYFKWNKADKREVTEIT